MIVQPSHHGSKILQVFSHISFKCYLNCCDFKQIIWIDCHNLGYMDISRARTKYLWNLGFTCMKIALCSFRFVPNWVKYIFLCEIYTDIQKPLLSTFSNENFSKIAFPGSSCISTSDTIFNTLVMNLPGKWRLYKSCVTFQWYWPFVYWK